MTHLLLGNAHSILDVSEHSRLNEVALVTDTFPADAQLGTLLLTTVNQLHYLRRLVGVDLQPTTNR